MIGRKLAAALALLIALPAAAPAAEIVVSALPLTRFEGVGIGDAVGGLIWRGGLVLESQTDLFGGLSGIGFVSDQGHLVMVSDHGNFVSGQLLYDDADRPLSLVGVEIEPIRNSKGNELPRAFARDSEALDTIVRDGRAAAVRVGFENLTRVADFNLVNHRPGGPAREVSIPDWVSGTRTNESLEAVCIAPPASPIAGSTLLLIENSPDTDGNDRGWLLGHRDKGPIGLTPVAGVNPSDCAFLPNGDLLVLERGISVFTFVMTLVRVPAAEVRPGTVMTGKPVLSAMGSDIDNMEGVAVHRGPDGRTLITLISDNNFNDWERSLILEFALPEGDPGGIYPRPAAPVSPPLSRPTPPGSPASP